MPPLINPNQNLLTQPLAVNLAMKEEKNLGIPGDARAKQARIPQMAQTMKTTTKPTRGLHARVRAWKQITRAIKALNKTDADLVARALFICYAK